jgi:hypothetical protein
MNKVTSLKLFDQHKTRNRLSYLQVERTSTYVERKENEGNHDYKINNTEFREENRHINCRCSTIL